MSPADARLSPAEGRPAGGRLGFLVLGLLLAALGAAWTARTLTLLDRAVPASGSVAYTTRYTIGVRFETADGAHGLVSVPRPGLAWPGAFRPGTRVGILVDPTVGEEPVLPIRGVFHPLHARLDSAFRLWMPSVLGLGFGMLCLTLYVLSVRSPGRLSTSFRLEWGGRGR